MTIFTIGQRTFSPKLSWFLVTCLVVFLLSSLGVWQLHRAEEKRTLLSRHASMFHAEPININHSISANKASEINADQPIQLTGTYDAQHIFLLDNQIYQHQIGYEVIEPVLLSPPAKYTIILISRGWIKAPSDRTQLPAITSPVGLKQLTGLAYFPSKSLILLGENWDNNTTQAWPKRIEKIDIAEIQQWLGQSVYPFILRLNPDEQDANPSNNFVRDWAIVSMPPERHTAYAVQWFAMALTVFIIFIILSVKKNHVSKK